MTILSHLTTDGVLDAVFAWLCNRRRDYPAHADVWGFRRHWPQEKMRIRAELLTGRYRFGPIAAPRAMPMASRQIQSTFPENTLPPSR